MVHREITIIIKVEIESLPQFHISKIATIRFDVSPYGFFSMSM